MSANPTTTIPQRTVRRIRCCRANLGASIFAAALTQLRHAIPSAIATEDESVMGAAHRVQWPVGVVMGTSISFRGATVTGGG